MPGDKTIVDAYVPALEALRDGPSTRGATLATRDSRGGGGAPQDGMRATTAMQARKGRASYLGPRSVGHQDPGATSTWLIFRSLAEAAARAGTDG